MAAYIIFIRDGEILDQDAMQAYIDTNAKGPKSDIMKPVIIYGETTALEGDAPDGVVVLQFPDMAAAKAWYESPHYQEAIPHRKRAAPYRVFMVEGL
ncbi:MAG: DUF1330 domain-containing protein [Sphingomonadaceae bacterium]|nr:DUF1330 domain-containing protein [Sphingomonadaceae bacterium]